MGRWRTETENWLASEAHGHDEVADAAFGHVFRALPTVEPSPGFVARAVEAASLAHARRRRVVRVMAAAAASLLAAAAATVLYVVLATIGGWLLTTTAAAASGAVLSLVAAALTIVEWWAATADAGSTIAAVVANPYSLGALVAIELVAAAALYTLHRLLRSDIEVHSPGALCF